ncbi:PREDICTED: pentatricopeptide repeat-containing protein At3g53360, mitochondrial-like [Nelumbo nucifera]|uniref:Pentatricopeptide repeat-containing protein At3g53360, mitochondrial-like n=1 Tax=Nelumbo nucifera TaxID=4432 RepID=A0A1U8PZ48_NELNU|nr:PREDICTED: pentatricopeptide repeat-containing protein At3g53360, mitochondrial-like [Nelumbo nucifera]
MYSKLSRIQDAFRVFEEIPIRDYTTYNSLMCGFGSNGFYEEAVVIFDQMLESDFFPNVASISYAIRACGELGSLDRGSLIHDCVIKNGLYSDVPIVNSLISMYIKVGRLDLGRQVFDDTPKKDIISWNSMITGYARSGYWVEAFELYISMRKFENLDPSRVTFLGLALACGQAHNLDLGKTIHGYLIRSGLMSDVRLGTSIVDMYSKCGAVKFARSVFEEDLPEKSLISWNSLLAGYSQNGYNHEAVLLFQQMFVDANLKLDAFTIANVVPAYANSADLQGVRSIHSIIVKNGLELDGDIVLGTAMVDAYGKCSDIEAATSVFNCIQNPSAVTWNVMISGYVLNRHAEQGIPLFLEMLNSNVFPDSITMVMLFQSCGELGSLKQGSMLHGYCLSKGFDSHATVNNAMIDMYIRCGCMKSSQVLFNSMPHKNVVTWNTMLGGYVKRGHSAMALKLFLCMQLENMHKPDLVTMISIIQACTYISGGRGGEMVHGFALKLGLDSDTLVANSLVDAYAKNGLIIEARSLFDQMDRLRDQSSWNVMIAACGVNGKGEETSSLFLQMEEDGFEPNSITFVSLLSSCSHSGMINEGCHYFDLMVSKYGIQPSLEHLTCIIDMFGRAGRLQEAYQLIKNGHHEGSNCNLLSDCDAVWRFLLSACKTNIIMELGKLAGEQLSRSAPDKCGYHTLLSNLYASGSKWDEAAKVRKIFEDGKLTKKRGWSLAMM